MFIIYIDLFKDSYQDFLTNFSRNPSINFSLYLFRHSFRYFSRYIFRESSEISLVILFCFPWVSFEGFSYVMESLWNCFEDFSGNPFGIRSWITLGTPSQIFLLGWMPVASKFCVLILDAKGTDKKYLGLMRINFNFPYNVDPYPTVYLHHRNQKWYSLMRSLQFCQHFVLF